MMYLYKDYEIIREHLVQSDFMDNYFIWSKHGETKPRTESIIDEREEKNMNANHVYSYHDDGGEDDVGENNHDRLDVEELMCNVAPDVLLQYRNKGFDNFETLDKVLRDLLYEECKGCLLAFLSHRIICKLTDASCSPSPRSIPGYRIHREAVTLSYLWNRTRINVANITRLSRGYVMGR
jgi:hypothetical protein